MSLPYADNTTPDPRRADWGRRSVWLAGAAAILWIAGFRGVWRPAWLLGNLAWLLTGVAVLRSAGVGNRSTADPTPLRRRQARIILAILPVMYVVANTDTWSDVHGWEAHIGGIGIAHATPRLCGDWRQQMTRQTLQFNLGDGWWFVLIHPGYPDLTEGILPKLNRAR